MPKWAMTTIGNCLERNSLNKFPKLLRRDYKMSGNYPVIDQGQSLIGGWTDDDSGLISKNLPVIIFGDHTRALKYIDFPFVRGADGTQVLKPKVGIEPLYFYYACRAINLSSRGYSRHFKIFKEKKIPLPPLSEQKRIVAGLNKKMAAAEKARAATLERVEAIQALSAAFLREIFSFDDGKLPQDWRWAQLGDVCKIVGGTTPSTLVPDYWDGDINWVTPSDLGKLEGSEIQTSSRKITRKALEETKLQILPVGTVVLSSRAPIGHLGIARIPFCTNQGCKSFIPSPKIETDYLYYGLKFYVPDFERLGSGATFKEISKTKLNKFEIPLPPLSEQKRIVVDLNKKMTAVEKARDAAEAESEATHALPAAFLREAFGGAL